MEQDEARYQLRFWNELVQTRVQVSYLRLYHEQNERIDRWLSILTAVASSGSIASWVVWTKLGFVWALIIASSQVVNAIRPFLPYQRQRKAVNALLNDVGQLALDSEQAWFGIAEGLLTDREIHDAQMKIKQRRLEAENTHLDDLALPLRTRLLASAKDQAQLYFAKNYSS